MQQLGKVCMIYRRCSCLQCETAENALDGDAGVRLWLLEPQHTMVLNQHPMNHSLSEQCRIAETHVCLPYGVLC